MSDPFNDEDCEDSDSWDERYPQPTPSHPGTQCDSCEGTGRQKNCQSWYCQFCNAIFCEECWPQQVAHKDKRNGRNLPGPPHARTDLAVFYRLRRTFDAAGDVAAQRQRHADDVDTTWFSVGLEEGDGGLPILYAHDRYADLMALNPAENTTRYPALVSFVGQTGAGKSSLLKILIDQKANLVDDRFKAACRTPVPGYATANNLNAPTTGDVHLYADPATFLGQHPILYADCEGLDAGNAVPVAVTVQQESISESTSSDPRQPQGRAQEFIQIFAPRVCRRELTWAANDPERQTRAFQVSQLYPRILYTFSEVIVFVLRNPK